MISQAENQKLNCGFRIKWDLKQTSSAVYEQIIKMTFTRYNKRLKENSRKLRNSSTLSEVILWNQLKAGKLRGYKFNRQKPIDNYIVDFYCKELCLAIEVDGDSHTGNQLKDICRVERIGSYDIFVLRFPDIYVKKALDVVLKKLDEYIDAFENGKIEDFDDRMV